MQTTAPWMQIPSRAISAVEHPCIVKNVDKGITSLGGPLKLSKGLRSKVEPDEDEIPNIISASLRPDDPLAKRLLSTPVTTNNLLLKLTLPKRTGRKRKRGTNGPFLSEEELPETDAGVKPNAASYVNAASLYRRLQDNPKNYTVSITGLIDETHRFRNLPDIQYAASTNKVMTSVRDTILPFNYNKLMGLNLNTAAGADLTQDVGPSAEFIQMPIAYNYKFQQNGYVKYTDDDNEINLQRSLTQSGYTIIKVHDRFVPQGPKPNLPPESRLSPFLQSLIANIRAELRQRPIITRHLLYNRLGWNIRDKLRQAAIYCGYFFESGPWREALIQWKVDPRSDPRYRIYQTVNFLSYRKSGNRHYTYHDKLVQHLSTIHPRELADQHKFDGKHVSSTGALYQFCDITDPLIRGILDTKDLRKTCAPTSQGWYHVGTWAKATVILKDKMNRILAEGQADDSLYERVITWPELWDDKEIYAPIRWEFFDKAVHREKAKEHTVIQNVRLAARNPRYAFEQMEAAQNPPDPSNSQEDAEYQEVEVPEDMTEVPETAATILNEGNAEDAEGDTEDDEARNIDSDDESDDSDYEPLGDDGEITVSTARQGPFGGLFDK
ncbi:hypothetical protein DM02DRAFT_533357 [Periconia macrospinosa]|uniref:Transcription factor tfiiic complex a box associated subunit sfc1 n=1 Tax=Periconia macrospinosa TaxID=97972 RepID=A0A2V1DJP9_9PLEO|nr:hypothetical protein DM02DRAFT_533357 [Periconia macrospinosa]